MKRVLTSALLAMIISCSYAQNTRLTEHNTIGWFATTITPAISKKISGHIEYQWRRDNLVKDWQQSLFRTGINFKIHPQLTLQTGYAWIETYPYGTYPLSAVAKRFPEHRIYEQVIVNSNIGKSSLSHRLRLEQRWLGRYTSATSEKPDETVYLNRFRYMPRLDIPLTDKAYVGIFDEILIGFGKNVNENVFDQNRVAVMLGLRPNNKVRIEGGFISQIV